MIRTPRYRGGVGAPNYAAAMLGEVDLPDVVAEVVEVFDRYEAALVANDLETLDALFWDSPLVVRFGPEGRQQGIEAIRAHRAALAFQTLPRRLRHRVVTTFGCDVAVVTVEFLPDGHPGVVGRQTQTWGRTERGWQVVDAHVSWLDGRPPV